MTRKDLATFKAGQRVRMDQKIGTIISPSICGVRFDDGSTSGCYNFELEGIQDASPEKEPVTKFQIGQQVRTKQGTGSIVEISDYDCWVRFDDGRILGFETSKITIPQTSTDAQDALPEKELAMQFHCGQQVKTKRGIGTIVQISNYDGRNFYHVCFSSGHRSCYYNWELEGVQEPSPKADLLDATLWLSIVTTIALLSWFFA